MSMRGEIISGEYNKLIFISDENGKELDDNQKNGASIQVLYQEILGKFELDGSICSP